jgi:energy-coupling factor transporter transmembrane protein EcfT
MWPGIFFLFLMRVAVDLGLPVVDLLRSARPAGLSFIFYFFSFISNEFKPADLYLN